jgi:cell division protein ZipA
LKELPNGGARVVQRGDLLRAAGHDAPDAEEKTPVAAPSSEPLAERDDATGNDEGQDSVMAGFSAEDDGPENLDWLDGMGADRTVQQEPDAAEPGMLPRDINPEVFMLNVVARDPRGFKGEDILHILLACDLRFGDMSFFHRHEFEAGKGAIQFSVANMMQPGVFDLDNMAGFTTPGLVFFLTLPGPEDMMKAFDYMLETAQAVSRNLGGDVLDESRSVLTKQTLDHCRQQIRDLERRLLART